MANIHLDIEEHPFNSSTLVQGVSDSIAAQVPVNENKIADANTTNSTDLLEKPDVIVHLSHNNVNNTTQNDTSSSSQEVRLCMKIEGENGGDGTQSPDEEEDIDELFKVEMENMTRASSKTIGSMGQLSLQGTSEELSSNEMPQSETLDDFTSSSKSKRDTPSSVSVLRNWSISAYRYTWQPLSEHLGFGKLSDTDAALRARALALRDSRAECLKVAGIASNMAIHLDGVVKTQRLLANEFLLLSVESPFLAKEFLCNAEVNGAFHKNGVVLVDMIRSFVAGIETLCNKTIDDTLAAVKQCESARLEYEAYKWGLGTRSLSAISLQQLIEKRSAYERLLKHTEVKLQLVEGNRVLVLKRHLTILRSALMAYFSGNRVALESMLKQMINKLPVTSGAVVSA